MIYYTSPKLNDEVALLQLVLRRHAQAAVGKRGSPGNLTTRN